MSRSLSNASGGYRSARQASARTDAPLRGEPSPSQSRRATKRLSENKSPSGPRGRGRYTTWYGLVDEFNRMIWAVTGPTGRRRGRRRRRTGHVAPLLESLDRLHNPARVGGWLATTARRECLRVLNANSGRSIGDDVVQQESSRRSWAVAGARGAEQGDPSRFRASA